MRVDRQHSRQAVWRDGGVVGRWNDRKELRATGRSVGRGVSGGPRKILDGWDNDENVVRAGPLLGIS